MVAWLVLGASALWLGVLTSISPCPLATNLAALSYVGRRVDRPSLVALNGLAYTLGRVLAYGALGAIIVLGALATPELSRGLQTWLNLFLGPVLVVVGMMVLELLPAPRFGLSGGLSPERIERLGLWGALLMGVVFALSFCPVSAALFFGSLIPLATRADSVVALPVLYGVGTGLPVLVFAVLFAAGVGSVGALHRRLTSVAIWGRRVTGVVLIAVGVYYTLIYVFGVQVV